MSPRRRAGQEYVFERYPVLADSQLRYLAVEEVDHVDHPAHVNTVRNPVSEALGTTGFAMTYHVLGPGDAFSGALHTHHDQEEVFYIVEGTATFELGKTRERVEVSADEFVRFAPGEFQHGYNATDEPVVGFAFGAPGAEHDWHRWRHSSSAATVARGLFTQTNRLKLAPGRPKHSRSE